MNATWARWWCDEQQGHRGGVVVYAYGRVWWGRSEREARAKANRATRADVEAARALERADGPTPPGRLRG